MLLYYSDVPTESRLINFIDTEKDDRTDAIIFFL